MWKKILLITILFTLISLIIVKAVDLNFTTNSILVFASNCDSSGDETTFEGNIDILINVNDYESDKINSDISDDFISQYPNYVSIEHLKRSEWISYHAFYKDGNASIFKQNCIVSFARNEGDYDELKRIKIVYFDDNGETIFVTDEIELPHENFFEDRYGSIRLDIENQTFENRIIVEIDSSIVSMVILIIFYIIVVPSVKFFVLYLFNIPKKRLLTLVSTLYYIIYATLYFGVFRFISARFITFMDSFNTLILNICIFLSIEIAIIVGLFSDKIKTKKLVQYQVISTIFLVFMLLLFATITAFII